MGTTTTNGLPYPDTGSSVDVPRDIRALADAVDLLQGKAFVVPLLGACGPTDIVNATITGVVVPGNVSQVVEVTLNGTIFFATTTGSCFTKILVDGVERPEGRTTWQFGPGMGDRRQVAIRYLGMVTPGTHSFSTTSGAAPTGVSWDTATTTLHQFAVRLLGPGSIVAG